MIDSLYRLFEQIYMKTHLHEMAHLGNINVQHAKKKNLFVFLYQREYKFEAPHINIGPNNWTAWAKIEIPSEKPKDISDIEILDYNKKVITANNKLRKIMLNWFNEEISSGFTNRDLSLKMWNVAVDSIRIGQI